MSSVGYIVCSLLLYLPFIVFVIFSFCNPETEIWYRVLNVPTKPSLDATISNGRIGHYLCWIGHPFWNISIIIALYTYPSILLSNMNSNNSLFHNIIFHSFQFIAIISFYIAGNMNPGKIQKKTMRPINDIVEDNDKNNILNEESALINNKDLVQQQSIYNNLKKHLIFYGYIRENIGNVMIPNDIKKLCVKYISFENIVMKFYSNNDDGYDDEYVPSSFCWRCKIIGPLRSNHCYYCDSCIAKFNCHDPWIGNCIGIKNHKYYLLWNIFQSVVYIWSLALFIEVLIHHNLTLNTLEWVSIVSVVLFVAICGFLRTLASMLELYLISTNQTNYEYFHPDILITSLTENYYEPNDKNKTEMTDQEIMILKRHFDKGFVRNWINYFCGERDDNYLYGNNLICELHFDDDDKQILQ